MVFLLYDKRVIVPLKGRDPVQKQIPDIRSWRIGVLAVLTSCIANAVALCLFYGLRDKFTNSQIVFARGWGILVIPLLFLRGDGSRISRRTVCGALAMTMATFMVMTTVRALGPDETVVFFTLVPIVTVLLSYVRGEAITKNTIICGFGVIAGIVIAFEPWRHVYTLNGCLSGFIGVLFVALFIEMTKVSKNSDAEKSFALGTAMLLGGLFTSTFAEWKVVTADTHLLGILTAVGLLTGAVKIGGNVLAIRLLPTTAYAILSQLEAPMAVLVSWFMLGKEPSLVKWVGVTIACSFTAFFCLLEQRYRKKFASCPP